MSYLCSPDVPPLVSKAILVHKAIALTSKFAWWNNAWRILNHVTVTPDTIHHPPPRHHGGTPWRISYLVAHPNKSHTLPQTIHLPSIPPILSPGPLPHHRPPLPPPPSPTVSMFQPPPGYWARPPFQHPQTTTYLSLLSKRLPWWWIPCIQMHSLPGPPDLLWYPNNIQAVLYLPYARLPHQGPKINLPGYVQNTPSVNPPTLVASTNLPPPPPRPPLKPLVLNYYYYHTNTHCILCHIYIPTKPLIISC